MPKFETPMPKQKSEEETMYDNYAYHKNIRNAQDLSESEKKDAEIWWKEKGKEMATKKEFIKPVTKIEKSKEYWEDEYRKLSQEYSSEELEKIYTDYAYRNLIQHGAEAMHISDKVIAIQEYKEKQAGEAVVEKAKEVLEEKPVEAEKQDKIAA